MALESKLATEIEVGREPLLSDVGPVIVGGAKVSTYGSEPSSADSGAMATTSRSEDNFKFNRTRIRLPTQSLVVAAERRSRLIPLQTWEGYVEAVDETNNLIRVRLSDLAHLGGSQEEISEISFDEIHEDDLELVRPGAVFRWIIGYRDQPFGRRERVSSFVFRRLPNWTREEIASAQKKAEELARAIRWK